MNAIQQIVDFILDADKLKQVERTVRPAGLERYENSAEHPWQIALLAISPARYADKDVDMSRGLRMRLVYDIGEIDGGDAIVLVEGGWKQRKADELVAMKRIYGLPQEQEAADR